MFLSTPIPQDNFLCISSTKKWSGVVPVLYMCVHTCIHTRRYCVYNTVAM